jgi:hypothetical protein
MQISAAIASARELQIARVTRFPMHYPIVITSLSIARARRSHGAKIAIARDIAEQEKETWDSSREDQLNIARARARSPSTPTPSSVVTDAKKRRRAMRPAL